MTKTGRKRIYEGDAAKRHSEAVKKYNRENTKQISLRVTPEEHEQIKTLAERENLTLKRYILKKILP